VVLIKKEIKLKLFNVALAQGYWNMKCEHFEPRKEVSKAQKGIVLEKGHN